VERPYTLSSAADDHALEITVKREPEGVFSGWLFDHVTAETPVEIAGPRGDCVWHANPRNPRPVVCLVAGIGVTPALAILRTALARGWIGRLHIDYSVRTPQQRGFAGEIERECSDGRITSRVRVTSREGRITTSDIAELVVAHPNAEFFICGPTAFNEQVSRALAAADAAGDSIHVEDFVPQGAPAVSSQTHKEPSDDLPLPPRVRWSIPWLGNAGFALDPVTFQVRIDRYVSMHDAGTLLNPLIADGQVHGAFVQGVAAALYEEFVYDEAGSFLSGSFADYLVPTVSEIPRLEILHQETPSPFTPLGAKGLAEGNCMSTPACIANAVADALGERLAAGGPRAATPLEAVESDSAPWA
jgi:ferredoxin-NADP reductase